MVLSGICIVDTITGSYHMICSSVAGLAYVSVGKLNTIINLSDPFKISKPFYSIFIDVYKRLSDS